MAFDAGSIFAKLSLDSASFEKGLNRATSASRTFVKRATGFFKGLQSTFRSLTRSVFNLRNALATGIFAIATKEFVSLASEVVRVETAFKSLAKIFEVDAVTAMNRLRAATRGTVDDLALFGNINTAIVLGVGDTVEEFELLIEAGRRLGQATGRTAVEGIQDLSIGLGRQSRLVLDNLGLIVRVEDAYRKFGKTIGKTARELNADEQRAAFLAESYDQIRKKLALLGPEQETLTLKVLRFNSEIKNLFQTIARNTVPALERLFDVIRDLNNQADGRRSFASILSEGVSGFIDSIASLIQDYGPKLKELLKDLSAIASNIAQVFGKLAELLAAAFDTAVINQRLGRFFGNLGIAIGNAFVQIGIIAGKSFQRAFFSDISTGGFALGIASNVAGTLGEAFEAERRRAEEQGVAIGPDASERLFELQRGIDALRGTLAERKKLDLNRDIKEEIQPQLDALQDGVRQIGDGLDIAPPTRFVEKYREFRDLWEDITRTTERFMTVGPDLAQTRLDQLRASNRRFRDVPLTPLERAQLNPDPNFSLFDQTVGRFNEILQRAQSAQASGELALDIEKWKLAARYTKDTFTEIYNGLDGLTDILDRQFVEPSFGVLSDQVDALNSQLIIDDLYGKPQDQQDAAELRSRYTNLFKDLAGTFRDSFENAIQNVANAFSSFFGDGTTLGSAFGIIGAGVGAAASFLSSTRNDPSTSVSRIPVEELASSQSAVRGVIAGPQTVAIAQIGSSIREANRGVESLLRDILDAIRNGNNGLTSGGLGAAGTV